MSRIWAVARQMIREAIRMKIAIVFIVLLVAILPTLPLIMEGDGTLRGRVQSFLHYALGAVSLILSLLTLFLASGSLTAEIRRKHVQMVLTKPIARWQFVAGKWLGICLLNAVLLFGSGLGIYAATQYLKGGREGPQGDRDRLLQEVLTARDARQPTVPDFRPQVNARYEDLRERGELPDQSPEFTKRKLHDMAMEQWRSIYPLDSRAFHITNLHFVDRRPEKRIFIRYKLNVTGRPPDEMIHSYWLIGDKTKGASEYGFARSDKFDAYHELPVPADAVADDGTLQVFFFNQYRTGLDDQEQAVRARTFPASISFEDAAGFEVLYGIISFGHNFVRCLAMLYCWLLFLAALGLFAASFLSFPVACMLCMLVYFTALGANFFQEAVTETDSMGRLIKYAGMTFLAVIPNFGYYDPVPTLVDGRLVTLRWVLGAIGSVALVRTAILGAIACAIFHRRELAEVVV